MPFSTTTKDHTEAYWTEFFSDFVIPGLEAHGYTAYRSSASLNNITKDIITELAYSNLVLAVLTDGNSNVFYELGARHSLRKGTIMILEKGMRPPFDVGHHGILFYDRHNLNEFKKDLKRRIEDAEAYRETNPVNECIHHLAITETVSVAVGVRNECAAIIQSKAKKGINKPLEDRLAEPLEEIRRIQEGWDSRGELDRKQVSIIVCHHNWENEKLILHAHVGTQNSPSTEWWRDELMESKSLFHEIIKRQSVGVRIAQMTQRRDRLTVIAFETVEIPPTQKCVIVAESHYYQ